MVYDTAIRTGDFVRWNQPQFTGSYRKPKYAGTIERAGTVIKHSYGADKGQHTFTIKLQASEHASEGAKLLVKGRNLYPNLIEHISDPNSPDRADNGKTLLR